MIGFKLLAAFVTAITFSITGFAGEARMYIWKDDKGITHIGDTIPPEYANKDRIELDKNARVKKKVDILTPEERRANEEANIKKRDEEQADLERKRRDKALINTYSNEKEIDLARSRDLLHVEARINSITSQQGIAEANMAGLKKDVDGYNKAGKKIPAYLQDDLNNAQARIVKLQNEIEKAKAEKAAIDAHYDADKARYRELTGKK